MIRCVVQPFVFLPSSQPLSITKMIVRLFYVQEALGHQLKESNVSRLNNLKFPTANRLALLNADCLTGRRTEGNRRSQSHTDDSPLARCKHNCYSRRHACMHTHAQYVFLTHPLTPLHTVQLDTLHFLTLCWVACHTTRVSGTSSASLTCSVSQWETFILTQARLAIVLPQGEHSQLERTSHFIYLPDMWSPTWH